MPKRTDIKKILLIGSGPIVISQACEFDYSGTQACKALKEEGYEVILVNSNPATIMTDPEFADRTYIEPVTPEIVEKIIEKERPDALLPTIGGQTALNVTTALAEAGVFEKYKVELIGANIEAINRAEDRNLFKVAMEEIGMSLPKSGYAYSVEDALKIAEDIGYPLVIRPAFTLGGTGGGFVYNREELIKQVTLGVEQSQINQVLVEESILGWKEYELEVMRDMKDNVVIICPIENFDPMGIHTGDSITVAPAQTLTDREYQRLRDYSVKIIRKIGVDTGGSNIQFAINPEDGRVVIIEMNPRVSRSSALASKATGFPIAKIAAKLAVGYTLDEIPNDITQKTPASFEPTIDYVVVKIPRFAFEKFPGADQFLNVQMKSVGESMAMGRNFKEAMQKALRSLEIDVAGFELLKGQIKDKKDNKKEAKEPAQKEAFINLPQNVQEQMSLYDQSLIPKVETSDSLDADSLNAELENNLRKPNHQRIFYIKEAILKGYTLESICEITQIDPWFIDQLIQIVEQEKSLVENNYLNIIQNPIITEFADAMLQPIAMSATVQEENKDIFKNQMLNAKKNGFSDKQLSKLWGTDEHSIRSIRKDYGVLPTYKMVDTCGAEFESFTPYFYSTYETEDEDVRSEKKKVIILGGGPNRIGQGIEFDYCCVHACFALREIGYETIMVNCNPETVSTDYDTSDKLYFEPMTFEDIMNIVEREKPLGVIVQFGGQTPLKLAVPLEQAGVPILGTSSDSIDMAEDRKRFSAMLKKLGIPYPDAGTAKSLEEAVKVADKIGYPVLVRPSYVLGGRAMEIVYDQHSLKEYMKMAVDVSPSHPILVDKFLEDSIEVDVDCVCDGDTVVIAGIMEHIEEAGIHSGDSACVIPPFTIGDDIIEKIKEYTTKMAKQLKVVGLMNTQYAIKGDNVYVLEVNPRASRTIPYVSKATGMPFAKIAAQVMAGEKLKTMGIEEPKIDHFAVKEVVLPFAKFTKQDVVLGPEMKSTGEVMGIGETFAEAIAKAQLGAGERLPTSGTVFISVNNRDKRSIIHIAKRLEEMDFKIVSTKGTAELLARSGISVKEVKKVSEGRPHIVDMIKSNEIDLIINTPLGKGSKADEYFIRREALMNKVMVITTISGASAVVSSIEEYRKGDLQVKAIQEYFSEKTV